MLDPTEEDSLVEVRLDTQEAFEVRDNDSANWLIRRITESRAYAERCAVWAGAEHDEQFLMMRYGGQLTAYARQRIGEAGGRRRSVTFPAGVAGFRAVAARFVVDDEAAALTWAKRHTPHLVTVVERLSKSGLIEHIKQTGEIPDRGVRLEPARESFYLK
jgi:hypothetical protein